MRLIAKPKISKPTIGVVVLTLNSKKHLAKCLPPFLDSPLKPRVVVVDSSSEDGTAQLAEAMGAEVLVVSRKTFNHGLTREQARRYLNSDIIVMVTPDAHARDRSLLQRLIRPIQDGEAAVAYARQIPHKNAGFFESFAREFNYPSEGHCRSIEDWDKYGAYTFFCSNSCAAYCNKSLDAIGGFKSVLLGEDTVATAQLLHEGHKIAYVADAVVYHSHGYSLKQEFQRYFDTGLARAEYRKLIATCRDDTSRGKRFVKEMMKRLLKEKPHLLPYGVAQTFAKWFGYKLGQKSVRAPNWFKRLFSGHKAYWA